MIEIAKVDKTFIGLFFKKIKYISPPHEYKAKAEIKTNQFVKHNFRSLGKETLIYAYPSTFWLFYQMFQHRKQSHLSNYEQNICTKRNKIDPLNFSQNYDQNCTLI